MGLAGEPTPPQQPRRVLGIGVRTDLETPKRDLRVVVNRMMNDVYGSNIGYNHNGVINHSLLWRSGQDSNTLPRKELSWAQG